MMEEYPDVLDVRNVATILRVSKSMVYELIHANQIKGFLVGRKFRILKSELIRYIEAANNEQENNFLQN